MNMRTERKAAGLTQAQLAMLLDVSVRTVERWESNATKPSAVTLKRMENIGRALELKGRRQRAGMSQEAMADLVGVTQSALSRWESLDRLPNSRMSWTCWHKAADLAESTAASTSTTPEPGPPPAP